MPGIGIGIGKFLSGSFGFNPKAGQSLVYSERVGLDLIESGSGQGLNAKILPSCANFGNALYLSKQVSNFGSTDSSGEFEFHFYYDGSPVYMFCSGNDASTQRYVIFAVLGGIPRISVRDGAVFTNIMLGQAITTGWKTILMGSTGSIYYITVNGVSQTITPSTGNNNGRWFNLATLRTNIVFGAQKLTTYTYSTAFKMTRAIYRSGGTIKNAWYFTGAGNYEYDVVGGNHVTWTGTNRQSFDINGNDQFLNVGYSLYVEPNGGKEYVPYSPTGIPYDASSFLTLFRHKADIPSTSRHNLAPSVVDFNYNDISNPLLGIFDRSNVSIYTNDARTSSDYDSLNTYRFNVLNIADPYKYINWRNVGYKGMQFSKIETDGDDITGIDEIFTYTSDKKGRVASNSIAEYCTINKFPYTIDSNGYIEMLNEVNTDFYGTSSAISAYSTHEIIQSSVNNSRMTRVVVGETLMEPYYVSQPIVIKKNGLKFDVKSSLRPMNGLSGTLSSDVAIGANTIVTPQASLLRVGEWIGITDDNALQLYETYRAWTEQIVSINGNVVELSHISPYAYQVSANARWAHVQNVVIVESDGVDVNAMGEINGMRDSQFQLHPVREYNSGVSEQQRAGCGLTYWKTTGGSVDGTIRDGLLHCLAATGDALHDVVGITLKAGLRLYNGHDKCCVFKYVDDYVVETGALFDGATWEDGFTLYYGCNNGTVGFISTPNNKRYGFAYNNECVGLVMEGLDASGNQDYGLEIAGTNVSIGTVNTDDSVLITDVWDTASNITIQQLNISGANKGLTLPVLYLQGGVTGVTIEELNIDSCTGIGIKAASYSGQFPTAVINGGGISNHTGAKTEIEVGSNITFNNFSGLP